MLEANAMEKATILSHLDALEEKCSGRTIELQEICKALGTNGHYLLIFFLVIPFLQPIPLFGLSTPFGILIAFVSILAYLKKPPWVPKRWANLELPAKTISLIAEGTENILNKIAFLMKPRWRNLTQRPFVVLNTSILIFNAILLTLPLPIPFSNAMPGWAILFQALAQLEEDGAFVILSYLQSIATIVFFIYVTKGALLSAEWLFFN